ncbi:PREDICTED: Krueppel homolog 2 [Rhagoletis zephyria]|uniref:Krueppel homolog 2 n=1 Tax=Rhagoletis zephyria TaxID=28612 RepID=UPI0008113123|nr:PREDICTED: Krueppel homolog 2 [Rhagoletis zephyria]XP_036320672.1 Krueppel homolog 2 isoform X1 [Rhagoletis pomonella]
MSDDASDNRQNNGSTSSSTPPLQQDSNGNILEKMQQHVRTNKVDVAMWATRMLTVLFTISYIVPIISNQQSSFNKVLLSNAATSALRLHQRLPSFTFSREFLARLFIEDSCHYLMFSLIFFNVQPTLLILIPIVLFAVLHASSYSLKLLDIIGQNSWWGARFLISLVEFQASNILKAASFAEIFIMPLAVVFTFRGKAGLMTPIVYYHFLVMRYSSRRNPYTRNAFAELRIKAEALAASSPAVVGKIIHSGIAFVNRLAPQQQPEQPTAAQ